ncbi:MAG: PH domain-containing protein [Cyclobacteriaceae bacterium]
MSMLPEDQLNDSHDLENLLFDNPPVDMSSLPSTETIEYNKLDSGYMWVMLIRTNVLYLLVTCSALLFLFIKADLTFEVWLYIVSAWFVLWLLANALIPFKYRSKGYGLRQHDIIYKTGLWWKKRVIVPFNRIQHCEVKQGPFSKIFGLKSLTVYTAGGGSSDLKVSGVPESKAEQLKEFVLRRITSEDGGE